MTKGKVVLVPFPFDDLATVKVRPAVCLTPPMGAYKHLIVAFITSHIPSELLPTDVIIDSKMTDFSQTGLRVSSTIRLHRLMTVSASFIRRELGILSPIMQKILDEKLRELFFLK